MTDSNEIVNGEDILSGLFKYAEDLADVENQQERGYAHLGWLMLEVADMQYWRVRYNTFAEYLRSVAKTAKKSPAQLHRYFITVRDLSGAFTATQLELMGITKAMRLRNAKDFAIVFPQVVVDAALDPKVSDAGLKKAISVTLKMPKDDGDWMDCEMEFMVSPEQRATIEQAIDVAMHTEPLTKTTISKSAQQLDVMMKLAMEFLGSHSGDGQ